MTEEEAKRWKELSSSERRKKVLLGEGTPMTADYSDTLSYTRAYKEWLEAKK